MVSPGVLMFGIKLSELWRLRASEFTVRVVC